MYITTELRAPFLSVFSNLGGCCICCRIFSSIGARPDQYGQEAYECHPCVLHPESVVRHGAHSCVAIVEDARHPQKYRMLLSTVDVIFADVAQPDQARIVAHNAHQFLKVDGHVVISIKANCIDSTAPAEAVFSKEIDTLRGEMFKPLEQITLEPYERDHAMVTGRSYDFEQPH
jgi:hypothetical protein